MPSAQTRQREFLSRATARSFRVECKTCSVEQTTTATDGLRFLVAHPEPEHKTWVEPLRRGRK